MTVLDEFHSYARIYESNHSVVYRALKRNSDESVVLKVLKSDAPSSRELVRYRQEIEIIRSLDCGGVIRVLDSVDEAGVHAIVLEDFGAESLAQLCKRGPLSLLQALQIAHAVALTLEDIHQRGVIHKDINPNNIVHNPSTGVTKLIDFGISTRALGQRTATVGPRRVEGTLAYISPEQTGRMNRHVNHSTDLYSFGATLYELVCAQPPFTTEDPNSLIHCHLAQPPTPPSELNPDVPEVISEIVLRLLAKCPEDRYTTALGVAHDLWSCIARLEAGQRPTLPRLGQRDGNQRLEIPQKLYGRERERERLIELFEETRSGIPQVVFVCGYAGIGKTSLVEELLRPVTLANGHYSSGKFDQLQRIPYAAFAQAMRGLVQQVLTTADDELARWREALLEELREDVQVMIDFIPDVARIVGHHPPVEALDPAQAELRFRRVLAEFTRLFSAREHPLVVHIDDVQWSDPLSLSFIEFLVSKAEIGHLMFVLSYRDAEVGLGHPVVRLRESLSSSGAVVHSITLDNLTEADVTALVAETLSLPELEAQRLAALIKRKTDGNPFFISQLLTALSESGALECRQHGERGGAWSWNEAKGDLAGFTDNVVDLVIDKLRQLPRDVQRALQLGASLGNHFDLRTVSLISEESLIDVSTALEAAAAQRYIMPTSELSTVRDGGGQPRLICAEYRFTHDRVQQAAYALASPAVASVTHTRIARLLLKELGATTDERLFEIADHLSRGAVPESLEERVTFAELSFRAANKAKHVPAFEAARDYVRRATEILDDEMWRTHHELCMRLTTLRVEMESVTGNHELAEELAERAIESSATRLERAALYLLIINQRSTLYRPQEALALGLRALAELQIELPTDGELMNAMLRDKADIDEALRGRDITSLIDLEMCTDPTASLAIDLLVSLVSPAYQSKPELMGLIATQAIKLSLAHGNRPSSAIAYGSHGAILCAFFHELEAGNGFADVALGLAEKLKARSLVSNATNAKSGFVGHWVQPFDTLTPLVQRAIQASEEVGEQQFSGYVVCLNVANRFMRGDSLESMATLCDRSIITTTKSSNALARLICQGSRMVVANLRGDAPRGEYRHGALTEEALFSEIEAQHADIARFIYLVQRAQSSFMYEDHEDATRSLDSARALLGAVAALAVTVDFHMYWVLCHVRELDASAASPGPEQEELVAQSMSVLQMAAKSCPANYAHRHVLAAAELARARGDVAAAIDGYDEAIHLAAEHGCTPIEALANHLAGRYWQRRGRTRIAAGYLLEAHLKYHDWGALQIATLLESRYAVLFPRFRGVHSAVRNEASTSTTGAIGETVDIQALVDASRLLSSETSLETLLYKVMELSMLNAGAEVGVLVLERDGMLLVKSRGLTVPSTQVELLSVELRNFADVSHAMIHYVARTGEKIVLDDASNDGLFMHDPHVQRVQSRSVLCVPLLNQGSLIAVIFMENRSSPGAFGPERVGLVELLTTPAAVSIENALLKSSRDGERFEYQVGGSLATTSQSYVARRADRELLDALSVGHISYVLCARQMGKSSLRVRTTERLRQDGVRCVSLDLSLLGSRGATPEQWYASIARSLVRGLGLQREVDLREWWVSLGQLTPVQRLSELIDTQILERIDAPIVVFIDEIDSVLALDFDSDDLFILIRALFNRRAEDARYRRLSFVFLGVASPSSLVRDTNRTPFNVGRGIVLGHFRLPEAKVMLKGLSHKGDAHSIIQHVFSWTNGQPFLTQKICSLLSKIETIPRAGEEALWVSEAVKAHVLDHWEDQDDPVHLGTIRDRIFYSKQRASLLDLHAELLERPRPPSDKSGLIEAELLLSGLIIREGEKLKVACRIYERVFNAEWIAQTRTRALAVPPSDQGPPGHRSR